MKQALAFALSAALLAVLLISCGDGSDPVELAAMPQPDLSVVAEPQLLEQVHTARDAVAAAPEGAANWAWLGHVYYLHGW